MRFGFNFGFLRRGTSSLANACLEPIGTDGTKYGFLKGSFGTIHPTATYTGDEFYEITWNPTTGDFIVSFGPTGDVQITNVATVHLVGASGKSIALVWDATTTAYIAHNLELVQGIPTTGDACFGLYFLPKLFIHYNFNTVLQGTAT